MTEPGEGLFERLTACREDVFRVCLGFSRNAADAEDLCQDVFLKALPRANGLRNPDGLRIWLLRIARTTCLDHIRRAKRRPMVSIDRLPGLGASELQADPSNAADSVLRQVKEAVVRLPSKQRDVFILREYGGLSYEEIARALGARLGTVMSRLNRARGTVARIVKEGTLEEP